MNNTQGLVLNSKKDDSLREYLMNPHLVLSTTIDKETYVKLEDMADYVMGVVDKNFIHGKTLLKWLKKQKKYGEDKGISTSWEKNLQRQLLDEYITAHNQSILSVIEYIEGKHE